MPLLGNVFFFFKQKTAYEIRPRDWSSDVCSSDLGWAVGIFVSGLVLRNGLGAETFAWSIMFLFLPLTCVYYPVTVLPAWLQAVAWSLPPTYVFEGMRALLIEQVFRADLMIQALALNAAWFALAVFAFLALLASDRRNGTLMQTGE